MLNSDALRNWEFPAEVGGWLLETEARTLAVLASGKRVLEVGSYQGRSTISMAQTAAELHSVDHHLGDADSGAGGTLPAFRENLARWGLLSKITIHIESFADAAVHLPLRSFDLVFVDGAHDLKSVQHDATQALRLVKPGGKVAFHDWDVPAVRQGAATAFAGEPAGVSGRTAWFDVRLATVEVCIPSRDGRIDDDVLMRAHSACEWASKRGVGCNLARVTDRYTVATCRNRGVAGFLSRKQFTHLLFLDDDVLLPAHGIENLVELAGPKTIVTGCIPSIRIDGDGNVAVYVQARVDGEWLLTWPAEPIRVEACGGGCMLIPRDVFHELEYPWFRWPETYREGIGVKATTDDTDFCARVREIGYEIVAHPRVRCGHKKTIDVGCFVDA